MNSAGRTSNIGEEFIQISPASKNCINIMEIRKVDSSANDLLDGPLTEKSELDNKYTVLDISELTGDLLTVGMFVALDYVWDKTKEDRRQLSYKNWSSLYNFFILVHHTLIYLFFLFMKMFRIYIMNPTRH